MSTDEYLGQLGRAHGFTLEELRANLAGSIHPAQLARGRRAGRGVVVVLALLGFVALSGGLAGAWLYHDGLYYPPTRTDRNASGVIAGAGVALALAFFVGAARGQARRRARRVAFERGAIDVVEGPLDKRHVGGTQRSWSFRVGARAFPTSERLWDLLTQGAAYRLHCVDDQLLSLAPAVEDPVERAEYERELAQFARSLDVRPSPRVK